jgi:hypothetical protein
MAKDTVSEGTRLEDLSDAEIERIEAVVFCLGGPPAVLRTRQCLRASLICPLPGTTLAGRG